MSELDKNLTTMAIGKQADKNNKRVILVTTDAYNMGINNLDVKLVIQWDIALSFNSMIQ